MFRFAMKQFLSSVTELLQNLLPQIRGGKTEVAALEDLIHKIKESPFNEDRLNKWLDFKQNELKTIQSFMAAFDSNSIEIITQSDHLEKWTLASQKTSIICILISQIVCKTNAYLLVMNNFDITNKQENKQENTYTNDLNTSWLQDTHLISYLKCQLALFIELKHANSYNARNIRFATYFSANKDELELPPGTLTCYEDGNRQIINLPKSPANVQAVCFDTDKIKISWMAENLSGILVRVYYKINDTLECFSENFMSEHNQSRELIITELKENTDYEIQVAMVHSNIGLLIPSWPIFFKTSNFSS